VILAVEKKIPSKLMEPVRSEKLLEVDTHCGVAMSGIVGDARILIDHARVEAQNHRFSYNEPMNVNSITQSVSDIAINFGEGYEGSKRKAMARPYGVALLIAGVDETGAHLYQTDPSGTFLEWQARAIGCGGQTAMDQIKDDYTDKMSLKEAEKLSIKVLKSVMEEKINKQNVELAVVTLESKKLEMRSEEYVQSIITELA
jgi:20S proteasome subunit alpha 5